MFENYRRFSAVVKPVDSGLGYCHSFSAVDRSELETTVDMAMLELDANERTRLEAEVGRTLEYFAQMSQVDVANVPPTTQAGVVSNRTRQDAPVSTANADVLLENAPDLEDRFIPIPNVL